MENRTGYLSGVQQTIPVMDLSLESGESMTGAIAKLMAIIYVGLVATM